MIGIYKFTNKYNRKVYIGQALDVEKRYLSHINEAKRITNCNNYFHNALHKYGSDGFDFDILIECPRENLDYWERFYINYYCSNNREYGYNRTSGGQTGFTHEVTKETRLKLSIANTGHTSPMKGKHHTEEAKEKDRQAHLGKPGTFTGKHHTEEANEKNRQAHLGKPGGMKGKHHTEEAKEKLRQYRGEKASMYGKHHPEETKDKIRQSHLGKHHKEESKQKMSNSHLGLPSCIKGKHKVWNDDTHTTFHYE